MRKRRVLAVLLALSLAVSGNGMTVLAAETGTEQSVVTTQEETVGTNEETGETETPSTSEEEKSETPGVTQEPGGSETPGTTENPEEQEPDKPKEDEAEEQPVEDEITDPAEEQLVEDEAEDPAKEQEEPAEAEKMLQNYVSRMVTFTDDTGMKVTYDANASTKYDYVVEDGVLTAVRIEKTDAEGNKSFEAASLEGNVELKQPDEGEKYTSIASSVFGGNQKITYVKLPAGVENIAAEAFKGCTALKGVYLPASVNKIENSAFANCTAMSQISVPKAVTSIGESAFQGDTRLYLVYMKDMEYSALTTIGASAFQNCSVLTAFCSDTGFVLPSALQNIGEAAFQDCKTITAVDFTENTRLTEMGSYAFAGCTKLTDVTFGKTLDQIAEYAFSGCDALRSVQFPLVDGETMSIESFAFQACFNLKELFLPQSVAMIKNDAFLGCSKLTRVELRNDNIVLEDRAFPEANKSILKIIATSGSKGYKYAKLKEMLPDKDGFYQYKVEDINGIPVADGKFAGGTLWVGMGTQAGYDQNINKSNKGQGVKSGETCYIYRSQTKEQEENFTFIKESLRCNGQPLQEKNGAYFFTMPEGGAVITAEFRAKTPENIKGTVVKAEFSAGEPIESGLRDEFGYKGVELKVGQTTRLFLLDGDGEPIPSSKISITSEDPNVATVNTNGMITAVGTNGKESARAKITVVVKGGDGNDIPINRTILVKTAEAGSITLKAYDYEKEFVTVSEKENGIQAAAIRKTLVKTEDMTFKLRANVYDETKDGVGRDLTWTTSNAKVAKVVQATTTAKNPVNTITVQKGCEGEATITVTAKNSIGAKAEKITQKFVVQVYQEGYKLASSTVTVNPKMKESGAIELISAYDYSIDDVNIKLYYDDKNKVNQGEVAEFTVNPDMGTQNGCRTFQIVPVGADTIREGKYNVQVGVKGSEENRMPLTINVKRTTPNPTVKFNTNKAKFNLYYKDGRADAGSEAPFVMTEITKLGDAKISKVELRSLSDKEDDVLFKENFEIDSTNTDLAKGKVAIKRRTGGLKYTSKKQPAVTGYLDIYYEGYRDDAKKTVRVTMPTCTTVPSYALRETSGTYRDACSEREEVFELYDKRSKTKEKVILGEKDSVSEVNEDILRDEPEIRDGAIVVNFIPERGTMKFVLKNSDWDLDKDGKERTLSYTYQVKISIVRPTVKTDRNVISLNLNYPEQPETFSLVSNQKGLEIEESQEFIAKQTRSNQNEICKLDVTYQNGVGQVRIKDGEKVKAGTYQFTCDPQTDWPGLAKTTLTVKVVDNKPVVKFGKGSLQLNTTAFRNNSVQNNLRAISDDLNESSTQPVVYQETSKISFKVNERPEGYSLAPVGEGDQATEIKCTTRNKSGAEEHFNFEVVEGETDDMLKVSLKDSVLTKGTYTFSMTPRYLKEGSTTVSAKSVNFNVKVIDEASIYLAVTARGRINLLDREGEPSDKNGIVYTPTLKNISGEITDVKIYDGTSLKSESRYFDIRMIEEGKDAGKFFVSPKKDVELKNNENYNVRIWVQVKDYAGTKGYNYGVTTNGVVRIKTAQSLPRVTISRSDMDVFLSTKNYNASFVVRPQEGSVGTVESVAFGEKDEMANDSFTLIQTPQVDGSMKVTVHLKEAVSFANGTTNNVKFYVKYKGQGTNTAETATGFTMKIKVN